MKDKIVFEIRKQQQLRLTSIGLIAIVLFYALVCTPIYLWAGSDVLIADSVFPLIWDTLMSICNYLYYWIAFSALIYAVTVFGLSESKRMIAIIASLSCIRYFANHFTGCFVTGFSSINAFFISYFPYIVIDVLFDLLLIAATVAIAHVLVKKVKVDPFSTQQAVSDFFLPIEKLFDFKNLFCRSALFSSVLLGALKLLSRVIYDFSYGAPQNLIDLLWMITFYAFDLLSVLIGYVLILLFINRLYLSDLKVKNE